MCRFNLWSWLLVQPVDTGKGYVQAGYEKLYYETKEAPTEKGDKLLCDIGVDVAKDRDSYKTYYEYFQQQKGEKIDI